MIVGWGFFCRKDRKMALIQMASVDEAVTALIAVSYTHLTLPTICSV